MLNAEQKLIWKKFKNNKPALFGLTFIILAIMVAVLGANIRPDDTENANEMCISLARKKPGFKQLFLSIPTSNKIEFENKIFLQKTFFGGNQSSHKIIPIAKYHFNANKIFFTEFADDGFVGDTASYYLSDFGEDYSQEKIETIFIKNKTFWLGTDRFGRDVLSRIMAGTMVSLSIGFVAVFIALLIGISLGATAGYFGGYVDAVISWFINIVWAIPTLLLVIAITLALGKGYWQVFIAVGCTTWVDVARVVRAQFMSLSKKEFVEASRALGYSNSRIIFKHILPNASSPIIVLSASNFANAILMEAGLSFLGIGAQPPTPSWGSMIKDHYGYIIMDSAYLAIIPGAAIMLLVLSFIMVGNGLRDALDSKLVLNV